MVRAKKYYCWHPSTIVCEKSWYLKSTVDNSVIEHHEVMKVMDIVSTYIENTISKNVMSIVSTSFDEKNVKHEMNW